MLKEVRSLKIEISLQMVKGNRVVPTCHRAKNSDGF